MYPAIKARINKFTSGKTLDELIGAPNPAVEGTDTLMKYNKLLQNQLGTDNPSIADKTSVMNYLRLLETTSAKDSSPFTPGIRSMGLDVGAKNNNLIITNGVISGYTNATVLVDGMNNLTGWTSTAGVSISTSWSTEGGSSIYMLGDSSYSSRSTYKTFNLTGVKKLKIDMNCIKGNDGGLRVQIDGVNVLTQGVGIGLNKECDVSTYTGNHTITLTQAVTNQADNGYFDNLRFEYENNAGYLLKSLTRLNLDRLTFPKIWKPANTKCKVDVCGADATQDFVPTGTVFGSNFDENITDFIGSIVAESNTSTSDTTNKKFGSASRAFNGSQVIQYADNEIWNMGSGDFYFDLWVRRAISGSVHYIFGQADASATTSTQSVWLTFLNDNTVKFCAVVGTTQYQVSTSVVGDTNFHHIRCGRNGNNIYISLDGIVSSPVAISGTINNSTNKFCFGRLGEFATTPLNGNIDEPIIVKGKPMNSANFTVPTTGYNNIKTVGANTITLSSNASATTDFYKDDILVVVSGTGAGQTRKVTAYNGTTKVATLDQAWATTPTTASEFTIYDGIASDISPGFDFSQIDYTLYPTVNVICSLEKQAGATASPSMGVPIVTSIEKDWASQTPVTVVSTTTTYSTLLSASGRTRLDELVALVTSSTSPIIRITIDGVIVVNDFTVSLTAIQGTYPIPFNLVAQNSLLVEVKSTNTNGSVLLASYSK